jgi:hypothetical protein
MHQNEVSHQFGLNSQSFHRLQNHEKICCSWIQKTINPLVIYFIIYLQQIRNFCLRHLSFKSTLKDFWTLGGDFIHLRWLGAILHQVAIRITIWNIWFLKSPPSPSFPQAILLVAFFCCQPWACPTFTYLMGPCYLGPSSISP